MPRRRRDADRPVTSEDVDASLARKIWIFAKVWKRCPKKGCRRAGECLRFDDCAGVSKEPYWPTEEDQRRYFQPLKAALLEMQGGRTRHDPDARKRDPPMPPAPKRTAPPSRPGPKGESRDRET